MNLLWHSRAFADGLRFIISSRLGRDLAVINRRWSHHSKRSGAWPLTTRLGVNVPTSIHPVFAKFADLRSGTKSRNSLEGLLRIAGIRNLLLVECDFAHEMVSDLSKMQFVKSIGYFHQPLQFLTDSWNGHHDCIDGAICVSNSQIPALRSLSKTEPCWVPLGIDTQFFKPDSVVNKKKEILTVGSHLRDFELLNVVAAKVKKVRPDFNFVLVAPSSVELGIINRELIELRSNLSDLQLREAYRSASILFMPLKEATANCAVLESMACGTAVVATDVGGVRDYVPEACGILCKATCPESHSAALLKLIDNSEMLIGISFACAANASRYAWPNVRRILRTYLDNSLALT